MKRVTAAVLLFCILTGLLSGCTGTAGQPHTPTGDGLTWDEGETAPVVQTKPQEQTQTMTLTCYPERTMNPYTCTDFTNRALFTLLYQSLFSVDRDYHTEPVLCREYTVSDDMRSYTFYLEKATFSDGSALTAADVAASLLAAKESSVYSGRFLHIEEISVTADGGVLVRTDIAFENLPMLLDIPIVKGSQTQLAEPVGTGPYYLESTSAGLWLQRRTNWWCKADMAATAASIPLVTAQTPAQIRDNFEFSDLTLVCADPGSDRYADFRCDYELWDCENGIFLYLACNMDSEVFSVPQVRTALTYAIDRDAIVEGYYRGFARSATLPASPLFPYYSKTLAEQYGFDALKFTQAVTDAQLQEAPVVLLVNREDTLRLRVARRIAEMLTQCGLAVTTSELTGEAYQYALQTRAYDLYLGQTKLSPNMDLSAFFSGNGALSYGGINDVAAYALCQEALANHGNYYTLHRTVMENGLLCPILFRSYAVYATRGAITKLTPARDSVFYYSLGKTMENTLRKD